LFEAEVIEVADGYPTAIQRRMTTVKKDNHTVIIFGSIDYDAGVSADIYSERYLKSPPREYIAN
jgi:hypothetical protein